MDNNLDLNIENTAQTDAVYGYAFEISSELERDHRRYDRVFVEEMEVG